MKLESVRVFVVGNPPPSYGGRYFIFLKLSTDLRHRGASARSMPRPSARMSSPR